MAAGSVWTEHAARSSLQMLNRVHKTWRCFATLLFLASDMGRDATFYSSAELRVWTFPERCGCRTYFFFRISKASGRRFPFHGGDKWVSTEAYGVRPPAVWWSPDRSVRNGRPLVETASWASSRNSVSSLMPIELSIPCVLSIAGGKPVNAAGSRLKPYASPMGHDVEHHGPDK